ncbi:MAG: hypothetical protein K5675_10610 [Lachnospiraceae bacterium]|nr:hypothetical protein [Lachnospiraceae bacterium]
MSARRRRRFEAKRPKSRLSIWTAAIGGGILILYGVLLALTVAGSDEAARWMAGIGVFAMIGAAIALGKSISPFRDQGFDTLNRWLGMLLPLAALLVWVWTYLVGIILG